MNAVASSSFNDAEYLTRRFTQIYLAALDNPEKAQGASFRVSQAQLFRLLEMWKYDAFAYREQPLPDVMGRRRPAYYDDTWHLKILASLEATQVEVFDAERTKEQVIDRLQDAMRSFGKLRVITDEVLAKQFKDFFAAFLVRLTGA